MLDDPVRVEVPQRNTAAENVEHFVYAVAEGAQARTIVACVAPTDNKYRPGAGNAQGRRHARVPSGKQDRTRYVGALPRQESGRGIKPRGAKLSRGI